jgi:hypothetical protein
VRARIAELARAIFDRHYADGQDGPNLRSFAHRKLIRQGKLPRAPRTALVYGADVHPWEDANGLDCDPRVEPKANAAYDAHRPPIRQGVPVDRAAREGNRCRPIHDGTPASSSRCQKVRRRRRMDAACALGCAGGCDLREYPRMGRSGRAPAPPAGEVLLQRTAGPVGQKR